MLNKIGKMAGVVHQKVHFGRGSWVYLSRVSSGAISCGPSDTKTKNKHTITNPNLSLQSKRQLSSRNRFFVNGSQQLMFLYHVVSSNFGIGMKKRHPPIRDMHLTNNNPNKLKDGDIVHMVNCNLYEHDTMDEQWLLDLENMDNYLVTASINVIDITFDYRLREVNLSM